MANTTWTEVDTDAEKMKFPAGKYYVGDICHVLGEECDEMTGAAFFTNGNYTVGCFGTDFEEGIFKDSEKNNYTVETGNIGLVPIELVKGDGHKFGRIITMNNEFTFSRTMYGTIWVTDIENPSNSFSIETDFEEEDEGSIVEVENEAGEVFTAMKDKDGNLRMLDGPIEDEDGEAIEYMYRGKPGVFLCAH